MRLSKVEPDRLNYCPPKLAEREGENVLESFISFLFFQPNGCLLFLSVLFAPPNRSSLVTIGRLTGLAVGEKGFPREFVDQRQNYSGFLVIRFRRRAAIRIVASNRREWWRRRLVSRRAVKRGRNGRPQCLLEPATHSGLRLIDLLQRFSPAIHVSIAESLP